MKFGSVTGNDIAKNPLNFRDDPEEIPSASRA